MTYSPDALRQIIRTSLQIVDLCSVDAEELVIGTAAAESLLGLLGTKQQGSGPALSVYQIEPATAIDLWARIQSRKELFARIRMATNNGSTLNITQLRYDPVLATIICRLKYLFIPEALPPSWDVPGMARYWKRYYNTYLGKGTEEEFIEKYYKYVLNK